MKRIWRTRRAVAAIVASGVLLQATGCTLDQATTEAIVSTVLPILLQVFLSSFTGGAYV